MTFGGGIAQSVQWLCYGLDDRGIIVRFPTGTKDYSLLQTTRLAPRRNQLFPRCATTDIHLMSRLGMIKLWLVRLGQVLGFPAFLDNRYVKAVRLSAISIARLYPSGNVPNTHLCKRGWVDPRATVRPEGLGGWKIPKTSSGTEPAQCPNLLRYRVTRSSEWVDFNLHWNIRHTYMFCVGMRITNT
jgi:hypothetical protein